MGRKTEQSRKLQERAEAVIPGGVDSPVRAFRAVGGEPPFIVRGEGSRIWDADGNEYIEYLGSWGPLILGHAAPEVVEAVDGRCEVYIEGGAQGHQLRRLQSAGSGTGGGGAVGLSPDGEGALREFGNGGDHVGHPPGQGLHQAQVRGEI